MIKNIILGTVVLSTFANASNLSDLVGNSMGDQEDQVRICYLFKNNKLVTKSICLHQSTYVSGGVLDAYTVDKKRYDLSRFADQPTFLNEEEAIEYSRNPRNLNVVKVSENSLNCYKTISKKVKIDLCIK